MSALEVDFLTDGGQAAETVSAALVAFLAAATRTLDVAIYDFHAREGASARIADASRVRAQVLRDGLALGGIGILLGIVLSVGAMRLLTSQLYEVSTSDPVVFPSPIDSAASDVAPMIASIGF